MCGSCDGFFSLLLKEIVWSLGVFQSERVLLPPPCPPQMVTKKDARKTHGVKGFLKVSVQNYLLGKWHTVNGERGREGQTLLEPAAGRWALVLPSVPLRSSARLSPAPRCTAPSGDRRRPCTLPGVGP